MIRALLLTLALIGTVMANTPKDFANGRDYQADFRIFKQFENWDILGEWELIDTAFHDNYQHLQLGARYLIQDGLKLGLHLRKATGLRHDEDWIKTGTTWKWQSTKDRDEFILIPEVDYRRWIAGKPLALELRARALANTDNDHRSLTTRAGLSYFFESFQLSAQYEANFPLNYGDLTIDEFWAYLMVQIPWQESFSFGYAVGFGELRWSAPENYPGDYENKLSSLRFKINFNYYF